MRAVQQPRDRLQPDVRVRRHVHLDRGAPRVEAVGEAPGPDQPAPGARQQAVDRHGAERRQVARARLERRRQHGRRRRRGLDGRGRGQVAHGPDCAPPWLSRNRLVAPRGRRGSMKPCERDPSPPACSRSSFSPAAATPTTSRRTSWSRSAASASSCARPTRDHPPRARPADRTGPRVPDRAPAHRRRRLQRALVVAPRPRRGAADGSRDRGLRRAAVLRRGAPRGLPDVLSVVRTDRGGTMTEATREVVVKGDGVALLQDIACGPNRWAADEPRLERRHRRGARSARAAAVGAGRVHVHHADDVREAEGLAARRA